MVPYNQTRRITRITLHHSSSFHGHRPVKLIVPIEQHCTILQLKLKIQARGYACAVPDSGASSGTGRHALLAPSLLSRLFVPPRPGGRCKSTAGSATLC
jgi:hypothetical protein